MSATDTPDSSDDALPPVDSTTAADPTDGSDSDSTTDDQVSECLGGTLQVVGEHAVDLSQWRQVMGRSSIVDAECVVAETFVNDMLNYRLACAHPTLGTADVVVGVACWGPCEINVGIGSVVHLLHLTEYDSTRNIWNGWTTLRTEDGSLAFVGIAADSLEFPARSDAFAPLDFERPGTGCGPDPVMTCPGDQIPIEIHAGAEQAFVVHKSQSVVEFGGVSYAVHVETSCQVKDAYRATLIVFAM